MVSFFFEGFTHVHKKKCVEGCIFTSSSFSFFFLLFFRSLHDVPNVQYVYTHTHFAQHVESLLLYRHAYTHTSLYLLFTIVFFFFGVVL